MQKSFYQIMSHANLVTHSSPYFGTQPNYNRRGTSAQQYKPRVSMYIQFWHRTHGHDKGTTESTRNLSAIWVHSSGLGCFSIQNDSQFAIVNSFLYAHAWSLHTLNILNTLNQMMVLKKQKLFGIDMIQAMISIAYWWSSLQESLEEVTLSTVLPLPYLLDQSFSMVDVGGTTTMST